MKYTRNRFATVALMVAATAIVVAAPDHLVTVGAIAATTVSVAVGLWLFGRILAMAPLKPRAVVFALALKVVRMRDYFARQTRNAEPRIEARWGMCPSA